MVVAVEVATPIADSKTINAAQIDPAATLRMLALPNQRGCILENEVEFATIVKIIAHQAARIVAFFTQMALRC